MLEICSTVSGGLEDPGDHGRIMDTPSLLPLRIFFIVCFFGTLFAGVYLLKHYERFFGVSPEGRRETSGERSYSKAQAAIVWIIAMKLFALMAWMM